ncbi:MULTISPECIES: hypothetical protein [Bacillaceae]|nr:MULTISPECIES: hypothetical protein [Bacillaceae]
MKEEQVEFTEISFGEMTNKEMNSYDAVIISENNLLKLLKVNMQMFT